MPIFKHDVIGSTPIIGATAGSVIFAGTDGVFQQDNTKLFWDDSVNELGIGTNNPNATLHVEGTTQLGSTTTPGATTLISPGATTQNMRYQMEIIDDTAQAAGTGSGIVFSAFVGAGTAPLASISGHKENSTVDNVASYLSFYTRAAASTATEQMRINSAGNITLAGTTITASSLATFTTAASLAMSSTTTLTLGGDATVNGSTTANGDITIQGTTSSTRTTSYVKLNPTAGTVIIGPMPSYNPTNETVLLARGATAAGAVFMYLTNNAAAQTGNDASFIFGGTVGAANNDVTVGRIKSIMTSSSAADLRFSTWTSQAENVDVVTFQSGGNVGIGITSPGAKLDVAGSSSNQLILKDTNTGIDATARTIKQAFVANNVAAAYQESASIRAILTPFTGVTFPRGELEFHTRSATAGGSGSDVTALTLDGEGDITSVATIITASSLATFTTAASLGMTSTTTLTLGANATINGGSGANEDLTLQGTSNATRASSYVLLQPTAGFVGVGMSTPLVKLHVSDSGSGAVNVFAIDNNVASAVGSGAQMLFQTNYDSGDLFVAGIEGRVLNVGSSTYEGSLIFKTQSFIEGTNTERARIDRIGFQQIASANNKATMNKVLYGATTDAATAVELTTNGSAGSGTSNRIQVPANATMSCVLNIAVKQSGSGNAKQMLRQFVITNNGGTTALSGAVTTLGTDVGDAALATVTCTITANNTDDCIKVEVNGVLATNLRYTCYIVSTETLYA